MRNILLLHGINLNILGKRDAAHYGVTTLQEIENITAAEAKQHGYNIIAYQSNHEGELVDKIQAETARIMGIIINPGAFTHYSYGLHDAILDTNLPAIEVHLSDITKRETWRAHSVIAPACVKVIQGMGTQGYIEACKCLIQQA